MSRRNTRLYQRGMHDRRIKRAQTEPFTSSRLSIYEEPRYDTYIGVTIKKYRLWFEGGESYWCECLDHYYRHSFCTKKRY